MKELYTEVQDTYLMLPNVEGRGLFSNTSTACSCSFKRTVFASTSLEKRRSEGGEGDKFSVAAPKNVMQLLRQRRETNIRP